MLKISLLIKTFKTSRANNSRISRIKNANFSGYCFHMNTDQWADFQICISALLSELIIFYSS